MDIDNDNHNHNDQSAAGRGIVSGTYKASVNVFGLQYQHTF